MIKDKTNIFIQSQVLTQKDFIRVQLSSALLSLSMIGLHICVTQPKKKRLSNLHLQPLRSY